MLLTQQWLIGIVTIQNVEPHLLNVYEHRYLHQQVVVTPLLNLH
jgi:hypothetical protein